jgi:hypothetical protein
MVDTVTSSPPPGVETLIAVVAGAQSAGDVLLSSNRLIDLLLDARSETAGAATDAIDVALAACAHRQIVPVTEALDLVATIAAQN